MNKEMYQKGTDWSLAAVWNEAAIKENKPLVERQYIYASEIGMPYYDRYLKMKAIPYTNPPNDRSLRKFLAGNIWEYVTKLILVACGIFKHEEIKVDAQPYPKLLEIHGRLDFIAGGYVDAVEATKRLNDLYLPDYLYTVGTKIIQALSGGILVEKILELKAVSTFAFAKVEKLKAALPNHIMQAYHYQKNKGIPANVVYCCKDDCRLMQFFIQPKVAEPLYFNDIEKISHYVSKKKTPPLEPLVKFEPLMGRFSKNLGVEYSPYLEHYGFSHPDAYREEVKFVDSWNRALGRYVKAELGHTTPTGKPTTITPGNKETRSQIEAAGFKFDELLRAAIAAGVAEEEEIAEF